jgi:predicted hydrocarbon binding protein
MTAMSKKKELIPLSLLDELHTSGAGYDVLRYISLPDLFGTEADTLLYFMGKNLARNMAINNLEDIYNIANKLGWGRLELVKEKKKTLTFQLMADAVFHRLQATFDVDFRLEAGFLAEAIQQLYGRECECNEKINDKIHLVEFTVYYTK